MYHALLSSWNERTPPSDRETSMEPYKGKKGHTFGRRRPVLRGDFPVHLKPKRDTKFRDLPPPTGKSPFRLDLKNVLDTGDYDAIVAAKKLMFHVNGDM